MHFESKQENRAKLKIRDFLKVPTPKKERANYEIMYMHKQARSIVSNDIQKQKSVA
jgi:hypothetical protein